MNEQKKLLLQMILNYLFDDQGSKIAWELPPIFPQEQRIEFTRPTPWRTRGYSPDGSDDALVERFEMTWTPHADFKVARIGKRGAYQPVDIRTSRWLKAFRYILSNQTSARTHLNLLHI